MKKRMFATVLSISLALLAILVMLTGCSSTAAAAGWAGITVSGDNLYTVSSAGQLEALTVANGNTLWNIAVDSTTTSGGGFGCAAPSNVAVYGNLAISGDLIYIAGYNGKLYTFSATTRLSNSVTLDPSNPKPVVGGPAVDQQKVFVASSDGWLYALDATSLDILWKFQTGNQVWSTPAVADGTVFIGSFDKKIYAIDENSGQEKWSFSTGGAIVATPVVDNGTVYVASFDRHIYALDETTGSLKWQYPAEGQNGSVPGEWFWATPVLSNGILYAPCLDGKVYAIDTASPANVTVFDLGNAVSSSPVVSGGKVIVATETGQIFSLDASTKQKIELKDLQLSVRSPLAAANGVVYVHTQQKEAIYAIDAEGGAVLWYMPITS